MNRVELSSQKINLFKRENAKERNTQTHQNPFGISFKGEILNSDVFVSSNKNMEAKASISEKGKLYASAIVGKVLSAREHLNRMMEPAVSFAGRLRQSAVDFADRVRAVEIPSLSPSEFISKLTRRKTREMQVQELMQKPVAELEDMLVQKLQLI